MSIVLIFAVYFLDFAPLAGSINLPDNGERREQKPSNARFFALNDILKQMNKDEKTQYLLFAKALAKKAGEIMQQYYRADQHIELKADESPVTIADKAINSYVIEQVQKKYPNHGVLGEEESWKAESELLWVCDPIDGTVAYIMHMPLSMFSLALVRNGVPVLAVAYNPWTNDIYSASQGSGAYRNEQKISVSERTWHDRPRILTSSHTGSREPADHLAIWQELQKLRISTSRVPGTVFKGCLVAEGSADGRIFVHDGAHDIAAIKLIIEEAGGKVTDISGGEQRYDQPINGAVMSNGLIHQELLDLVKQHENIRD